jgi:hypothetical protein
MSSTTTKLTMMVSMLISTFLLQVELLAALSMMPLDSSSPPGRHIVPLHRQRVPVRSDTDSVSYKSVYFGNIKVGAPVAQAFTVVFDTGSGHVVLPSKYCTSETCRIHNRYDPRASKHSIDVDYDGTPVEPGNSRDQITVAYGTGEITGQFVNDRLCLGLKDKFKVREGGGTQTNGSAADVQGSDGSEEPIDIGEAPPHCVEIRIVMATEMTHEPFHAFAFDGVLGLGLDSLALAPEFSFFGEMAKQKILEQPSFGVFLADSDDEVSEISFGGHAPEHIKSELSWAPVAMPDLGYWQVQISKLRIGNRSVDFCDDGQCRAVVDTGTSLLAVPRSFADELQDSLDEGLVDPPPEKDGTLDCKKALGTEVHFEIQGITLTLTPGDYSRASVQMRDENDNSWSALEPSTSDTPESPKDTDEQSEKKVDSSCRPTIMPLDLPEPLGPKLFIWGEPVLRKYYTVYNWKEKSVGFGLARHKSDELAKAVEEPLATTKPRRKPLLL